MYTLAIINIDSSGTFTVTDQLPETVTYIPDSATATAGLVTFADGVLTWSGAFGDAQHIQASYAVTVTTTADVPLLITNEATLYLYDMTKKAIARTYVDPVQVFMPLIRRHSGAARDANR